MDHNMIISISKRREDTPPILIKVPVQIVNAPNQSGQGRMAY
jgi:hypothetical protein